ncbi:MAG: hypothetical protein WD512_13630 [Candidatus Paceibacterota bacterium]
MELSKIQAGDFAKSNIINEVGLVINTPEGLRVIFKRNFGKVDYNCEYRRLPKEESSYESNYIPLQWEYSWEKAEPISIKLSLNTWIEFKSKSGYTWIYYITKQKENDIYGYGWCKECWYSNGYFGNVNSIKLESIKEIDPTAYFEKECEKRGFVPGVRVKSAYDDQAKILDYRNGGFNNHNNAFGSRIFLFYDGKWAKLAEDKIELTLKINGKSVSLSDLSEETLLSIRKNN